MQLMREDEKRKRSDIKLPKGVKLDDTTPATPFWRDGSIEGVKKLDKPLNVEKVPDVNKYIQTGQGV